MTPETRATFGFAVAFMPMSWAFGVNDRGHKVAYAMGPFRLIKYRYLHAWRQSSR